VEGTSIGERQGVGEMNLFCKLAAHMFNIAGITSFVTGDIHKGILWLILGTVVMIKDDLYKIQENMKETGER
jgi:hypothetical protein